MQIAYVRSIGSGISLFLTSATRRCLSSLPDHTRIIMPKVSPTMTAGRLVTWKKKEGEGFSEGDDIADVESDKATMPIEARDDGFMAKIFVQEDTPDIPLGRLLAIVVEEEEDIAAFKDYQPEDKSEPDQSPTPQSTEQQAEPQPTPNQQHDQPTTRYEGPLGPAIMRLLNEYPSLNLDVVTPTGPKGRILKGDVLSAIESGVALASSPVATTTQSTTTNATESQSSSSTDVSAEAGNARHVKYTDISVTSMRRAIAKRLNKTAVPHRYASATYTLNNLSAMRKQINASVGADSKVSVNDMVIKAVAVALQRVSEMNVRWDAASGTVLPNDTIDISMAVAIEGGLITPIVPNADRKGLLEIARMTKALTAKAKDGTLAPEEFEGGSFSISNLGMLGISHFSAIINPPQSGILAVGAPCKFSHLPTCSILFQTESR